MFDLLQISLAKVSPIGQQMGFIYAIINVTYIALIQICAGGVAGEDTCTGDSGGPLVKKGPTGPPYQQVGIVSFGLANCGTNAPAVYTNVVEYRDWILRTIRP